MEICRKLAGYSYARADIVRRAMSKKKTEAMQAEREAFLDGCVAKGIDKDIAAEIFEEMLGFAKYAFNKSHATVYGVISYRTAYLKAHYPAAYFTALLTSVLDNQNKLKEYIDDAARYGVRVLPPDINSSGADFTVDGNDIRFGLLAIRNVGRIFADAVVRMRRSSGFRSFDDFVSRMSGFDLNKRTVESLIKCGVFDSLGVTRSSLMKCFESILESEQNKKRSNVTGQLDLFSAMAESAQESIGYVYPDEPEYSLRELLLLEKESSGMYFSGHMIDNYSDNISTLKTDKISDILEAFSEDGDGNAHGARYSDKSRVSIAGMISAKKTKVTKSGSTMAFLTVEDRYAEIEVLVFAKQYSEVADILSVDKAVFIEGNLSVEENDAPKVLLSTVRLLVENGSFKDEKPKQAEAKTSGELKRLFVKVSSLNEPRMSVLYRLAALNRGAAQVVLFDESSGKYSALKNITINPSEDIINKLTATFGKGNVILK